MKIMQTSRDDMVIPKVIDVVWHIVRLVDWRVPLVWMLLAINFLFTYIAIKGGLIWLEIMAADDPFKYPGAYSAMIWFGLAFLSLGLITLAGATSAAWARHAWLPGFDAGKAASRLLLAIHIVVLSGSLISVVGVSLYSDWWSFPSYNPWLPTSFLAVVLTAAALITYSVLRGPAWRDNFLAKYLPLIHQACVLWLLIVFYGSTMGNTVDLIK